MAQERKMAMVGRKVSFAEAEDDDLFFWADKKWQERLAETERLRKMIYTHHLGTYPEKMEKVGGFVKFSETDDL